VAQAPPCPYCGASSYHLRGKRWLLCRECGHEFDLERELCRHCGHLVQAQDAVCPHCQSPLREDTVDRIITDRGKDRLAWRAEQVAGAIERSKDEEEASRQRMDAYWAEERVRRETLDRARAEQRAQERKVLIAVVAFAAVIVLAVIAVMALRAIAG
jgi:RNA polymerase subunit RPABC4/transcription elongation factor Spt4